MDEVDQVDKVLFKIATSDTDEALSNSLKKHLAPTLLKLTSQNEAVRKKVMELLVHVNKRIKNNDKIQLPIEALLDQYQNPSASSFVINFTIIYLKMGFPRLPLDAKVQLIPAFILSLGEYSIICIYYRAILSKFF